MSSNNDIAGENNGSECSAEDALQLLLPETTATLATLAETPMHIANATLRAVPFGSRASLQELGILSEHYTLTAFGCEVIELATQQTR